MNLPAAVDAAIDAGFFIVCSPTAYRAIRDHARIREAHLVAASIAAGRGRFAIPPINIVPHPKQVDPVMLAFDDRLACRAHLDALDAKQQGLTP